MAAWRTKADLLVRNPSCTEIISWNCPRRREHASSCENNINNDHIEAELLKATVNAICLCVCWLWMVFCWTTPANPRNRMDIFRITEKLSCKRRRHQNGVQALSKRFRRTTNSKNGLKFSLYDLCMRSVLLKYVLLYYFILLQFWVVQIRTGIITARNSWQSLVSKSGQITLCTYRRVLITYLKVFFKFCVYCSHLNINVSLLCPSTISKESNLLKQKKKNCRQLRKTT